MDEKYTKAEFDVLKITDSPCLAPDNFSPLKPSAICLELAKGREEKIFEAFPTD